MANILPMHGSGAMTPDQVRAFRDFDSVIVDAINLARDAGVPYGLIVAILHGHAHAETQKMMQD